MSQDENFTTSDTAGTKELDLARWLIENKDEILGHVPRNKQFHYLPESLYFIYVTNYPGVVLQTIKDLAPQTLTPEELSSIVTQEWVTMILGKDVFKP